MIDLISLQSLVIVSLITWNCHFVLLMKRNYGKTWIFFILLQEFVSSLGVKGTLSNSWTICLLLNFLQYVVVLKFLNLLSCPKYVCYELSYIHWISCLRFTLVVLWSTSFMGYMLVIVRIVKLEAGFVGCACGSLQHGFYFYFLMIKWGQVLHKFRAV